MKKFSQLHLPVFHTLSTMAQLSHPNPKVPRKEHSEGCVHFIYEVFWQLVLSCSLPDFRWYRQSLVFQSSAERTQQDISGVA